MKLVKHSSPFCSAMNRQLFDVGVASAEGVGAGLHSLGRRFSILSLPGYVDSFLLKYMTPHVASIQLPKPTMTSARM